MISISPVYPKPATRPISFPRKLTEMRHTPHFGVGGDTFQSQASPSKLQTEYAKLLQHVAKGDKSEVQKMVSTKMYINSLYEDQTPLQLAAFHGHTPVIQVLAAAEAKLNQTNSWGQTPLWLAVDQQHLESVKELVKRGADVNMATHSGSTPLWILAHNPDKKNVAEEMAKVLIDAGADLNKPCKGLTPMQAARESGNEHIVQLLREHKAINWDRLRSQEHWRQEEPLLRSLEKKMLGEEP